MHLNSELLFIKYGVEFLKDGNKVLEIGPHNVPSPYQMLTRNDTILWHSLDLYKSHPDLTYVSTEEYNYPIESNSYDVIISGQVIEHVKRIWDWMNELKRLVKPGGIIIIINPISWPYHAYPVDCWRIFPDGMKALCEYCDLDVVFSHFESIEAEHFTSTYTPTVPGVSYTFLNMPRRTQLIKCWNAVIHFIPLFNRLKVSLEVAYDTISVIRRKG